MGGRLTDGALGGIHGSGGVYSWLLVIALGLSVSQAVQAQNSWWLRVAQSLTTPIDVATVAQVAEALEPGAVIGPLPAPIADLTSLTLDAGQPPVLRAEQALAPYISAARAAGASNMATVTGPWFLQTTLAIKALRRHGVIQDQGDCDAVVRTLVDSVLVGAGIWSTDPVFEAFAQSLRVVACAPAERVYVRAESLIRPLAAAGGGPSAKGLAVPPAGQIAYNTFPERPVPVTQCVFPASTFPLWILSDGTAVVFIGGNTNQVGHLLADYSRHYPAMLVLNGPPPVAYGATFKGALYHRTGSGTIAPAGQCD